MTTTGGEAGAATGGGQEAPGVTFRTGLYPEMSDAIYHGDPCPAPSLSSGLIRTLTTGTPRHAWLAHPRLGKSEDKASTKAQDYGSLVHKLALGAGRDVEIIEADSYRTKAAQEQRDAAQAAGRIPILEPAYADALAQAEPIRDAITALAGEGWQGEVAMIGQRETAHGTIWTRAKADALSADRSVIVDLKTTQKLDDKAIKNRLAEYDTQDVHYRATLESARSDLIGRTRFVFLFIENSTGIMRPVGLSEGWRHAADLAVTEAAETFARCLKARQWPAYAAAPELFEPPPWLVRARLEKACASVADDHHDTDHQPTDDDDRPDLF